jgi:hypothetical protein
MAPSTQCPPHIIPIEQLNKTVQIITELFVAQPFSWVDVGYGDELHLNFGQAYTKQYQNGLITRKGDWSLTTSASLWALTQNDQLIIDYTALDGELERENKAQLHEKFNVLVDQQIQSVALEKIAPGLKTIFKFSEGFSFTLMPHNNPELELWQLFMPTQQVLTIENKAPFWSCRSIHDRY